MKKVLGYVLMSHSELDDIHRFYEKRYMKLCEDYVKVDMELLKLKGDDPNRPRCQIIGNTVFHSSKGIDIGR